MNARHVLYWFDVEDPTLTQSDDAAKRLCQILTKHGVRGTMKLVGQKVRLLRERVRYDVSDALGLHAIGYHTDWHGLRPQPVEYMGPLDYLQGQAEFERRERRGLDEIMDMWGVTPVCYGQPGSNWSPQVFPVLRKWGIPTYVSGFGCVGLNAQPFYYGGIINTSHLYGSDEQGREVRHAFGLNFELGTPGALETHQRLFTESYERLEQGGLISIMNHPCTLVMYEWFSTDMKTIEEREAAYQHFEQFIEWVNGHEAVRTVTADELPALYPDRAQGRTFSREELLTLAEGVGDIVYFQRLGDVTISAAELMGMFAAFLSGFVSGTSPARAEWRYLDGPVSRPAGEGGAVALTADELAALVPPLDREMQGYRRLPVVAAEGIALEQGLVALAQAVVSVIKQGRLPGEVRVGPVENRLREHVDVAAYESSCNNVMMRPGFTAPKLLEQAYLQAWTLKPAVLAR